jgi:phosphoglycolate phosphatase/pyrophosphatase PpaX
MERYGLEPSEVLVVDDLKPGYDMARAAGVSFGAAGWAYDVPTIEAFMRKNCDYYFKTTNELYKLLFEEE